MNRTPEAARVRLDPHPSRTTLLGGAWWPRSTDVITELPALVEILAQSRGTITHVLLNPAEWGLPHPARAAAGRSAIRLGWYTSQPAGLVTIMSDFGRDRSTSWWSHPTPAGDPPTPRWQPQPTDTTHTMRPNCSPASSASTDQLSPSPDGRGEGRKKFDYSRSA